MCIMHPGLPDLSSKEISPSACGQIGPVYLKTISNSSCFLVSGCPVREIISPGIIFCCMKCRGKSKRKEVTYAVSVLGLVLVILGCSHQFGLNVTQPIASCMTYCHPWVLSFRANCSGIWMFNCTADCISL